jgi:hypothetical protein
MMRVVGPYQSSRVANALGPKGTDMTTIAYRDAPKRHQSPSFSTGLFTSASTYVRKLSERVKQWQAEREIESMPIDLRKDLGWPAADITRGRK